MVDTPCGIRIRERTQGTGFAVNRGSQRWDLERQVRLAAGSVVLASVLGSVTVPKTTWLAAAAGGGLVFASLSNSCAVGRLLARLPYNRGPSLRTEHRRFSTRRTRDNPAESTEMLHSFWSRPCVTNARYTPTHTLS